MIWRPLRQTLRCFAPRPYQERITADEREIKDFPKLPSATSFIRKTLGETVALNKTQSYEDVR